MALFVGCDAVPASSPPVESTLLTRATRLMDEVRSGGTPESVAQLQFEAARLTEQSYRLSGNPREALAAVALYAGLAGGPLECRGKLYAATLKGELMGRPELARQAAIESRDTGCAAEASRVLMTVGNDMPAPQAEITAVPYTPESDSSSRAAVRVTQIERYGAIDTARIVVFLSGPTEYHAGALPAEVGRGPRLYVDLDGAEYDGPSRFDVGGVVERVRVGEGDQGVRVVLDLRERVYQRVFYLPEPFRLIIDVSNDTPRLHPTTGERGVHRVVLDPGHGGYDPGALGSSGLQEKDVALDLAHRAAPLIARELGIDTLLTRDTDEFVPLDERVAKANAFSADLFISLHCNASETAESHGVMTFVLDVSKDALAERVAARENSASRAASQHFVAMLSQVMDAEGVARSMHFAELLQRASIASLSPGYGPLHDGGVRRAGFFVLAGAQMPAVLFEASFISNPTEEQRLDTADYRQKLADAVVNAVRAYRDGL